VPELPPITEVDVTALGEVLVVHRATVDQLCRRCGAVVARGRRVALVAGVGTVHLRCILVAQEATVTRPDKPAPTPTGERLDPAAVVEDDDQDPRDTPWFDR
jgi:hypothetical protein